MTERRKKTPEEIDHWIQEYMGTFQGSELEEHLKLMEKTHDQYWREERLRYFYSTVNNITIKELRGMQNEDLINYIDLVIDHGLLKPRTFKQNQSQWKLAEEYLFTKLKVSQVKELPKKYQSLLGYKDGKKIPVKKRTFNIGEVRMDDVLGLAYYFVVLVPPLLLLSLCVGLPREDCTTITYQDFDSNYNVVTKKGRVCGDAQSQVHDRWKD